MKTFELILLVVLSLFIKIHTNETSTHTLKLLHVVFRHGNRNYGELIPYSENFNISYSDGFLTEEGKENSYLLGQWLQDRYGEFLGPYSSDLVETANTVFERTRASLILVLRGLFSSKDLPAGKNLKFDKNEFRLTDLPMNNTLFVLPNPTCINYFNFYINYTKNESYQNMLNKYTNLNGHLKTHLNRTLTTLLEFLSIYDTLDIQRENGLRLPLWAESVMPTLESTVMDFFTATTSTKELNKILIGGFIKRVVKSATLKFNNQLQPKNRKLFIYSGHDLNVYCALKLFKPKLKERPPYNSCLIIEAHTIGGVDGFKVFYKNSLDDEVQAVNIPDCGLFCPLPKFTQLYEEYFPTFDTC